MSTIGPNGTVADFFHISPLFYAVPLIFKMVQYGTGWYTHHIRRVHL